MTAVSATQPAVGIAIVLAPLLLNRSASLCANTSADSTYRTVGLAAAAAAAEQARDAAHDLASETAAPWGRSVALTLLRTAVVIL